MKIEGVERVKKPYEADPLPTDRMELMRLRGMAEEDSAKVKAQLDMAKAKAIEGEFVDPIWYARASAARRFIAVSIQKIILAQATATDSRKEENMRRSDIRERRINQSVYRVLARRFSPEVAQEVMDEAEAIADAKKETL